MTEKADEVFTMRKTTLLLILLASIILLYRVAFGTIGTISTISTSSPEYYEPQDLYVLAQGPPVFIETEVLHTKTKDEFFEIISQYDWDANIAYQIMLCESSGNPEAHNLNYKTRDNSFGLFQVNLYGRLASERPSAEWLLVAENNIEYAYKLYKGRGWQHWSNCHRKVR